MLYPAEVTLTVVNKSGDVLYREGQVRHIRGVSRRNAGNKFRANGRLELGVRFGEERPDAAHIVDVDRLEQIGR